MISLIYKKITENGFGYCCNKKSTKILVDLEKILKYFYFTNVSSLINLVAPAYLSITQST